MRMPEVRRAINTLDFTGVPLPKPDKKPYFFQVVIDPGVGKDSVYVTTRYKESCPPDYVPDYDLKSGHGLHNDLPGIVGKLLGNANRLGPKAVSALMKSQQKTKEFNGTPGETYDLTSGRKGVLGASICVPLGLTMDAVEIAREVINEKFGPIFIALRFVQKSDGYMSFTRFDPGCVLDLDGLDTKSARNVLTRIYKRLDAAGIPYTQHFGKIHGFTKARLKAGWGDRVERWKMARKRILTDPDERFVFSNDLTDKLGLT